MRRLDRYLKGLPTGPYVASMAVLIFAVVTTAALLGGTRLGAAIGTGVVLGLLFAVTEVAWRRPSALDGNRFRAAVRAASGRRRARSIRAG
jgi:hypothetical protein